MSIINNARLLNPLVLIHFEGNQLNLEGSESFNGGWVNGSPSFLVFNGLNYAISDGTFWGAFTGSGSISGDKSLEAVMSIGQISKWARFFEFGSTTDYTDFINLGTRDSTGDLIFFKRYRIGSSKNSTLTALSSESPDLGTYFHVVANYYDSTGEVDLFINNVKIVGQYKYSDAKGYSNSMARFSIFASTAFAFSNGTEDIFLGKMGMGAYYNRVLTDSEISSNYLAFRTGTGVEIQNKTLKVRTARWGNRKSRESTLLETPSLIQNLTLKTNFNHLITKQGNYLNNLDRSGVARKAGYFESKVLIQDVPAPNRKVMCFTQHGQLLDETYSAEDGTYRFDHLLLDTKYLFVAHDNQDTPNTPPEYQAVAAGFQTATPYVED